LKWTRRDVIDGLKIAPLLRYSLATLGMSTSLGFTSRGGGRFNFKIGFQTTSLKNQSRKKNKCVVVECGRSMKKNQGTLSNTHKLFTNNIGFISVVDLVRRPRFPWLSRILAIYLAHPLTPRIGNRSQSGKN